MKKHFTGHPARTAADIWACILAGYGENYSISGVAKLMRRLGFEYKKPIALCTQADPEKQPAFIDWYEALMNALPPDEKVLFSDAVHPEDQCRDDPANAGKD